MILTTTETVAGRPIVVTFSIVVASVPFFGTKYGEGITDLNGNTSPDVAAVYEKRRYEVLKRLAVVAGDIAGANAVIGVRFHDREITATWKELCAYGTPVRLG